MDLVAGLAYGVNLGIYWLYIELERSTRILLSRSECLPTQLCCLSAVGTMFS